MISRRQVVQSLGAATSLPLLNACTAPLLANDISQLEATRVASIVPIRALSDIQEALNQPGWISVAGGRFSMGGQTSADQSRQLDCALYNQLIHLDAAAKVVRVQAGMRWRDLQEILDPHNLSVKVMQSFSNFSIGGSVSVNCHGRYVGNGSIASTVRALQIVLPNGEVLETSRAQNSDLFAAAIGGYGLMGIISEVELDVVDNTTLERKIDSVALEEYPAWFAQLKNDPTVVMHNADLTPPLLQPTHCRYLPHQHKRTDRPPKIVAPHSFIRQRAKRHLGVHRIARRRRVAAKNGDQQTAPPTQSGDPQSGGQFGRGGVRTPHPVYVHLFVAGIFHSRAKFSPLCAKNGGNFTRAQRQRVKRLHPPRPFRHHFGVALGQ